jgi:hypothetical protein
MSIGRLLVHRASGDAVMATNLATQEKCVVRATLR